MKNYQVVFEIWAKKKKVDRPSHPSIHPIPSHPNPTNRQYKLAGRLVPRDGRSDGLSTERARLGTARARLATVRARLGTARARLGTVRARLGTVRARLDTVHARLAGGSLHEVGNIYICHSARVAIILMFSPFLRYYFSVFFMFVCLYVCLFVSLSSQMNIKGK